MADNEPVMSTTPNTIDTDASAATFIPETPDTLDLRELIERFEELETRKETADHYAANPDDYVGEFYTPEFLASIPMDDEDRDELRQLTALLDGLKGKGGDDQFRGDWYPITLIRDDYFEEYAREYAEDGFDAGSETRWPFCHIDWSAAAESLQMDYSTVEWGGVDYWYR